MAPELVVIDDGGNNVGLMTRDKALRAAQEKGLDLIEVAPSAKPPVAKIMSFDKYRYQQEKKFKKQKAGQKTQEMKQVQISARIAAHDLATKTKQINKFLGEGHPVNIVMVLRGREKANKQWAGEKLKEFLTTINPHKVISPIKSAMRGMQVQISKIWKKQLPKEFDSLKVAN